MGRAEWEGWSDYARGGPWHFFKGRRSACGRITLEGAPAGGYSPEPPRMGERCRRCQREWAERELFAMRPGG